MASSRTPKVSIIVRAFNEEKYLPDLFDGIESQEFQDYEVLLVDSGSFDKTRAIARERGARLVEIQSQDFTFGYSLNRGIEEAKGESIVLISAHTKPFDSKWLSTLVAALSPGVAMVYGRQLGVEDSKLSEIYDFDRVYPKIGPPRIALPEFFANNANSAFPKMLWKAHRFDEKLPGLEDVEWARYWHRKGQKIEYVPDAGIYHIHRESWPQVKRRYYREAVANRVMQVRSRRHVPLEVVGEFARGISDFFRAIGSGRFALTEIIRYRMNKAIGTAQGLLDSTELKNYHERKKYLFDRGNSAVRILGPGRAVMETVAVPELKPGDVLIKTAYVAVCGTDLEILEGTLGYYRSGFAQYPITPGHEFSGRVVSMGPNVKHLKVGDPVVAECIQGCGSCARCRDGNAIGCEKRKELGVIGADGAYSDYLVVSGEFVHTIPIEIDLRKAALCEPLAVILKGLRRLGGNLKGKKVAVVGAGPLGHLCARALVAKGVLPTVFDHNVNRLELFKNSKIRASRHLEAEIDEFDVIVEVTGSKEALDTVLKNSHADAQVLLLGFPYGKTEFNFENLVGYDKTLVGSVGSGKEDFVAAIRLLPELELSAFFENVLNLEEFEEGWSRFRDRGVLKVLLSPN